ncbi:ATP-dependent RNA helicase, partial [Candidatus Collierbacteria bacterium CG17_big_fil_post_rev_8_21_14_2_50_45_7]
MQKNIAHKGYIDPTPIQDQVIPEILEGHDVIGLASTGT